MTSDSTTDWQTLISKVGEPRFTPFALNFVCWSYAKPEIMANFERVGAMIDLIAAHGTGKPRPNFNSSRADYWRADFVIDPRYDWLEKPEIWKDRSGNLYLTYTETSGHGPDPRIRLLRREIMADPAQNWKTDLPPHPAEQTKPIYRIEACQMSDARALAQIGAATFLESFVEQIDGEAIIKHCETQHSSDVYSKYLSAPRGKAWIARYEETGVPIGYALNCEPELDEISPQDGDVELKRIYAFPRFHGEGIGKALLDASIVHAREIGAPRLLLGTYEGNGRAVAFYKKNGFDIIGTRQFFVGGVYYDDVIMSLSL